jgi:hypothetical protein
MRFYVLKEAQITIEQCWWSRTRDGRTRLLSAVSYLLSLEYRFSNPTSGLIPGRGTLGAGGYAVLE